MFDLNKAIVMTKAWIDEHPGSSVIGWDSCVPEVLADNIEYYTEKCETWEEFAYEVAGTIDKMHDDPETYGVAFPIYTADSIKIWDNHGDEVESFAEAVEAEGSITDQIERGVWEFVYNDAQDILRDLQSKLDELTTELEEVFSDDE